MSERAANQSAESFGSPKETVRHYFARMSLRGQSRAGLAQWASLPVESYFVAMKLPQSDLNRERRECGAAVSTLGALFSNVKWG